MNNSDSKIIKKNGKTFIEVKKIIFSSKRKIDWNGVEAYAKKYIGKAFVLKELNKEVFIGIDFPDEYANSNYKKQALGTIGKAKANAIQIIPELIEYATDISYQKNKKDKHNKDAKEGWYRCTVYFTIPITNDKKQVIGKNDYQGKIILRKSQDGKIYIYDLISIKKET